MPLLLLLLLLLSEPLFLPFPLSLPLPLLSLLGVGPSGDTVVPAVVGAEAAAAEEGSLLLRAWSRTRRPITGPLSGPSQSPRV
jgi:hypothetical protein